METIINLAPNYKSVTFFFYWIKSLQTNAQEDSLTHF